ncbi:MAG: signal peptidase I [Candidatus Brocadiia bacterium]
MLTISTKAYKNIKRVLLYARIALSVVIVAAVAYMFFFFETFSIPTDFQCMKPFIAGGDRVYVRKNPSAGSIERFNIVIYSPPDRTELKIIGRVIGLPGESISSLNGAVYINGVRLEETFYLAGTTSNIPEDFPDFKIPQNGFYVLVDDRKYVQIDSREFGAIPAGNLLGKLIVKF